KRLAELFAGCGAFLEESAADRPAAGGAFRDREVFFFWFDFFFRAADFFEFGQRRGRSFFTFFARRAFFSRCPFFTSCSFFALRSCGSGGAGGTGSSFDARRSSLGAELLQHARLDLARARDEEVGPECGSPEGDEQRHDRDHQSWRRST